MTDLSEPSCTVNGRRFVQRLVHARQGGQIDDAAPTDVFPDAAEDINNNVIDLVAQQILRFHSKVRQEVSNHTLTGYEIDNDAARDDQ